MAKYSLWTLDHESIYTIRDTSSSKEVDKWLEKDCDHAASFYREENEVNAAYLQTFEN
jgi:hypothetical protein